MRSLALLLALLLAACAPQADLDSLVRGESGRVAQVRNGEVLVLEDGLVVRLAGVEAPGSGEPAGDAAQAALKRLAEGEDVTLHYGGARRDAYGRALAQVRRKDGRLWLQGAMLRDGHVRVRTYDDNRALARAMLDAEARARRASRGLWAEPVYQVRLPNETGPGFQLVEGRIDRVWRTGEDVGLAFDRGRLVMVIPARALRDFDNAGLSPGALPGRLVRVRGVVGAGGEVRLDHPEMIEPLADARS